MTCPLWASVTGGLRGRVEHGQVRKWSGRLCRGHTRRTILYPIGRCTVRGVNRGPASRWSLQITWCFSFTSTAIYVLVLLKFIQVAAGLRRGGRGAAAKCARQSYVR